MIISKEKIEITTINAVIAMVLGIAGIFAIFYNAKADASDRVNAVSQRVATIEQKTSDTDARLGRIENKLDGVLTSFRSIKGY